MCLIFVCLRVKDAMELYQIGRFLDLDILSQNCEDAIVQRLNHNNIAEVSIFFKGIVLTTTTLHNRCLSGLANHMVLLGFTDRLINSSLRTLHTLQCPLPWRG